MPTEIENDIDLFDTAMPDLTLPPAQRGVNWHKQCIRHFSSFYNIRLNVFGTSEEGYQGTPLEQMRENYSYVLGRQVNKDYAFFATDYTSNTQDALGIVSGQKVAQLVEWMRGKFLQMINNMDMEAQTITREAKTKEQDMFTKLMIKYLMKPELQDLQENFGVEFAPAGNFQPEISEDVARFMARDFHSNMEIISKDLAQDILHNNYYKELFLLCATHVLAVGVTGVDCIVRDGKIKWEHIPSHLLIIDRGNDDPLNRKARFGGYITYKTPSEIFAEFAIQGEEKELIKKLGNGETIGTGELGYNYETLNATHLGKFNWWSTKGNNMEIACVKMYWKCTEDAGYNVKINKFGNKTIIPKDYTTKYSDSIYEGWRQGVMIGNLLLKNAGQTPNQVGHINDYVESNLPLKIFMPGMILGENRSMVDKLKKHQDRLDAYRRKSTDLAAQAGGRGVIINGSVFGIKEGDKIIADLKRDGLSVVNLQTGESDDPAIDMRQHIHSVDLTGDPNIKLYIDLMREEERQMEELANIPKIAQGTQSGYTGAQVQSSTLAQSDLGTATTYLGFIDWCTYLTQYSVNVAKYAMTAKNDNYVARLKIGDVGFKYAQITRELRLEECQIWFKVQDVIDDQAKQRIRAYAQAFSQNPEWGVGPEDILRLEKARTWTEMIEDLEYSIQKKKGEQMQKQAYQDMLAMVLKQQQLEANKENAQLQAATTEKGNQEKIQADILKTAIKQNPSLVS